MVKIAFHPLYMHSVPAGHRFPMKKYELISEQLLYEVCINANRFFKPNICSDETVLLTHDLAYLNRLKNLALTQKEERAIGFEQSYKLIERELTIADGTVQCATYAMNNGCALNVAGGTHHAFKDRGEGFCLLNDIAIASNYLLYHKLAKKVLIIDLDVHQGNGTAAIFKDNNQVFTFSMHGEHNYPFRKEKSDLDIALLDGTDDDTYLDILKEQLDKIHSTNNFDFAFYQSGVDILETDKLGKLNISLDACRQRDELVFQSLYQRNIPVVVSMGGGYSPDIDIIVAAHINTFKLALQYWD